MTAPAQDRERPHADARAEVDHVVVGTGFSGLAMAHELVRRGYTSIRILERGDGPGGVWRSNTYPGSACDVPSHLYSLEALPDHDWSRVYPPQAEILDYLESIYRALRLDRFCSFHTELVAADWDDVAGRWELTCADGETLTCRFLYAGTGQLPVPTMPDLPGLERFSGASFHSSRWRHDIDLADKAVAVIGTGASAIQIVPELAKTARHLYVIQRNAPYVLPRGDRAYKRWERALFLKSAGVRHAYRTLLYAKHEINGLAFFTQPRLLGVVRATTRRLIRRALRDPVLRERATPRYQAGCKRILVSDDYFPALARPNVSLIASAIERATETGAVCDDGTPIALDVMVFATGFEGTCPMPGIAVTGRGGATLHQRWDREGVSAFYGTQMSGFPNLFLLIGPNVGLAHNSVIYMMEAQVEFVGRIVTHAVLKDREAEVRPEVEADFNKRLDERMSRTVWQTGGCISWYHDRAGRNVGLWPEYTFLYRQRMRRAGWRSQCDAAHG